jgi:flagellar hook protein FlgE
MMAALFSGVSGLRNNLTKMNVIGNNIANVNTIGFKTGRVTFREALVQTYKSAGRPSSIPGGTNPLQLGRGMLVSTIDNLFQQGGLETTGQITDLAIQGQGFFILADGAGSQFYTRAGAFGFDANSTLVDPSTGMFVQGKMADASGEIPSMAVVGNIIMPFGQQDPAAATTSIIISNNLNSVATDSLATLVSAGDTGINFVSGSAINGAGGMHTITITGNQATQSSFAGSNVADDGTGNPGATLAANMTLASLGVTDTSNFALSTDNGSHVLGNVKR